MIHDLIMIKIIDEKIDRNAIESLYHECFFEMTNNFLRDLSDFYNGIHEFGSISSFSSASSPEIIEETVIYFRIDDEKSDRIDSVKSDDISINSLDSDENQLDCCDNNEKTPSLGAFRLEDNSNFHI